jgi:hypothetical protein
MVCRRASGWKIHVLTEPVRRLFLIAVGSTVVLGLKSYFFSSAATDLTAKLRSLTFKAMLRQDGK